MNFLLYTALLLSHKRLHCSILLVSSLPELSQDVILILQTFWVLLLLLLLVPDPSPRPLSSFSLLPSSSSIYYCSVSIN